MTRISDRRTIERQWRKYLASDQPKLQRALDKVWRNQQRDVTLADLDFMVANGKIPQRLADEWEDAYGEFVNGRLTNFWTAAARSNKGFIARGLTQIGVRLGTSDDYLAAMDTWVKTRGGVLIKGLSVGQKAAVNNLLRWHIINEPLSARELAKVLEPIIPLDARQVLAVRRRRLLLMAEGVTGADLERQVADYARYQQRVRATRIARTELTTAYNQGGVQSIRSAINDGDLDPGATKEWLTAEDERVCPICRPLDDEPGNIVPIDGEFSSLGFSSGAPPIHPQCRCTLLYDVEPFGFDV